MQVMENQGLQGNITIKQCHYARESQLASINQAEYFFHTGRGVWQF